MSDKKLYRVTKFIEDAKKMCIGFISGFISHGFDLISDYKVPFKNDSWNFKLNVLFKCVAGRYVGSRPIKLRKSSWRNRSLDVVRKKDKEKAMLIGLLTGRN